MGLLMPMVVFALLVTKELLKNQEEELFQSKPIKVAHSSVNVSPKIDNPKLDIDTKKTLIINLTIIKDRITHTYTIPL